MNSVTRAGSYIGKKVGEGAHGRLRGNICRETRLRAHWTDWGWGMNDPTCQRGVRLRAILHGILGQRYQTTEKATKDFQKTVSSHCKCEAAREPGGGHVHRPR